MADLFNFNKSAHYVQPIFPPCANISDTFNFQYLPKEQVGITSGNSTILEMDLSDILQPTTSWTQQKQIIQPYAVCYIPGNTKGLVRRTQVFDIPYNPYTIDNMFMIVDFSINYYNNFKYFTTDVSTQSNYGQNLDIQTALNLKLNSSNIPVSATNDPSTFKFYANNIGWDYNVTNVVLTYIDASMDINSPIAPIIVNGVRVPITFNLTEDISSGFPSAKYPNGAMLGVVLKTVYPNDNNIAETDKWIYLHNVKDKLTYYVPTTVNYDTSVNASTSVVFDPSTYIGTQPTYLTLPDVSGNVNSSTLTNKFIENASIGNSLIVDCSIKSSILNLSCDVSSSFITNSMFNVYQLQVNASTSIYITDGISLIDSSSYRASVINSIIWNSSINNADIKDCSIYGGYLEDSSLIGCTLYNVNKLRVSETNDRIIDINMTLNSSVNINHDTSTFYTQVTKKIDVGLNGNSTNDTISAGDYLDYVNTNNLWYKIGVLYTRLGQNDADGSNVNNLVNGFYVFNPQYFPVEIEYLLIN